MLLATAVIASSSAVVMTPADATPVVASIAGQDVMPAFYTPPASIPSERGAIIRSEPMEYHQDPLHVTQLPGTATRIMYASRDRAGEPIAVTGTVIEPDKPWTGPGERPVIGYAVGTQGLADRCAPSYSGTYGWEYEVIGMRNLLKQGYALAITDYEGLGTPGPETYMNRQVEGTAVIDSVRAARELPTAHVSTSAPVAFVGYSQGGGAASSAAELVGDYAPELDVRGTFAGSVPADLALLADNMDGGLYSIFVGYTIAGLADGYGIDTDPLLNDAGERELRAVRDTCTIDVPGHALRSYRTLTTDGSSAKQLLESPPFAQVTAQQRIGERRPSAPVLVYHSLLDDIVPYSMGRQLATDWCEQGARVQLVTDVTPTHIGSYVASAPTVNAFLGKAFGGKTTPSSCWRL